MANAAIVAIFALQIGFRPNDVTNMFQALFSGVLIVPTAAFGVMYMLTVMFNLATPFKLMDLSQPSKPLLQRLLREAPGTYQHSLQVANLAEQAAQAIGADTQITHVASLYHDIGKMSNPFFFTENQLHIANPHDELDDPYRSADIIINHTIAGDNIAKRHNLPHRIREFISASITARRRFTSSISGRWRRPAMTTASISPISATRAPSRRAARRPSS